MHIFLVSNGMLHTVNTQLEIMRRSHPLTGIGGLPLAMEKILRTFKDVLALYLKP
jgi:hypothetical protein